MSSPAPAERPSAPASRPGAEADEAAADRASMAFLGAGLGAVVAVAVLGDPWRGWLLWSLSVASAAAVGVAWNRRRVQQRPNESLGFLFAGALLLVPGYLLWYPLALRHDLRLELSFGVTDVLFLTAYVCYLVSLVWRNRQLSSGDRSGELLESLIVTVGLGVVAWVFVISPYVRDDSLGVLAQAAAVAYPLLDLALLTVVLHMRTLSGISVRGNLLAVGWVAAQLVADLLYAVRVLDGRFLLSDDLVVLYPLSFVLLGAAVLQPATGARPPADRVRLVGVPRLSVVALAGLIAPGALVSLAIQGKTDEVAPLAVLCGVLFVLILVRIRLLVVDLDAHQRVQSQLRRSIGEERRRMAENRDLVRSLRERQALAERLFRIQRKISSRAPLQEVIDAVTEGAAELLGDEVVGLRLISDVDPTRMELVAWVGVPPGEEEALRYARVGEGVGGMAIERDRLYIQEAYDEWDNALAAFATTGLQTAMAAPVHLEGRPIGSLTVASHDPARRYSVAEQEILIAFAEHVSLALNDARTVQAMHAALDHAVHQAMHDALTGLPNRACLYDRTDQALRAAHRHGTQTAVLLFDLDRFKEINDTLGHRYGDEVLCQIGQRLQPVLREGDTLARLGGDEFCVLLPDVADTDAAVEVAHRVIGALVEPIDVDGVRLSVEASCGLTLAPLHGDSAEVLIQRADVAMYVAKGSRADVVVYDDSHDLNTPERLAVLSELRGAIDDGQLHIHVQPQARLADGTISGVEALVRWDHPRLGMLSPNRFIPIAEDSGLIRPLTAWVLDTALATLQGWRNDGAPLPEGFTMSVNLSTRSLLDESFHEEVTTALERRGALAQSLVLEITETMIMADPARAHRLLRRLAATGVGIAIDDFGTGYSSLGMLKTLPVHQLKIDKSFVTEMDEDVNDATIVRSVVELGHTLGLQVVAEGVERQATWQELADLGCDEAQGYLLAKPMPTDQFVGWLARRATEVVAS